MPLIAGSRAANARPPPLQHSFYAFYIPLLFISHLLLLSLLMAMMARLLFVLDHLLRGLHDPVLVPVDPFECEELQDAGRLSWHNAMGMLAVRYELSYFSGLST